MKPLPNGSAATENRHVTCPLIYHRYRLSIVCKCVQSLATGDSGWQTISLSLNVVYSNSANSNSGGSWSLTAKTSDFGLSGLQTHIMNITNVFDVSPYGIVNNTDPAGFYQGDFFFFVPPDGATPGYYELNFGQSPIFTPGHEQGAFYGVGQLANGSPNYSGKPAGSNSEGPTLSTLAQTFGIPWATGDVFGDPTWSTGALLAAGSFATGTTPAFFSNNNGNVFKTLGTSTAFGTVGAVTVSTIVRTNLVSITADYNHNGVVDMADYVLWRDTLNQNVTAGSGADGSGNGVIDQADYSVWRGTLATMPVLARAVEACPPARFRSLLVRCYLPSARWLFTVEFGRGGFARRLL